MNFFRKLAGGIGDVAKFAAPALTFIPGVGPVAAAAAGAAGGALGKLNDKGATVGDALKSAVGYGAAGYGGARLMGGGGSGPSNVGGALENLLNNGGDALDYLSSKEHSSLIPLITGAASTGMAMRGANQAGQVADEQTGYDRRNDPMKQKLMQMFMDRFAAMPAAGAR